MTMPGPLRIGVIGHVEHITLGRVAALPRAGDIVHVQEPRVLAGGGGGIAFFQLARGPVELHLFTALGDDDAAGFVERAIAAAPARVHAVRRAQPHTRDVVMIGPDGERTILVVGEPLHPRADDPLPWEIIDELDAVYFTAQDPALLARARHARVLVAAARRRECIAAAGIELDAIVGSRADPRERAARADYAVPPAALVMTEGPLGGAVETAGGVARFASPRADVTGGTYGAGDSFAGALTYYLAAGMSALEAAVHAAHHGAAVVGSLDPLAAQLPLSLPAPAPPPAPP
ncbi:MAG TPA: PfkB family carbohydrate kinase [Kofleriaceae bacterium]|nr:PfkB family carbohydrate kinase [Kofleriaceae bacterium]